MRHPLRVLLVGAPGAALRATEATLRARPQMLVTTQLLGNGGTPVLSEPQERCDAIVLVVDGAWQGVFQRCFPGGASARHPLLVLGVADDMELIRTAMRAGARDFFPLPARTEELSTALDRLAREEHERRGGLSARVTAFINAKGGSGASFCAVNFAHMLAKGLKRHALLLDFEMQFGTLPTYFDLQSRNGLIRALEQVDALDMAALQGYTQAHDSGLTLLTPAAEGLVLPEDIPEAAVGKLFAVLDEAYEELVVDLPRRIDHGTAAVLDRSDAVMVVAQQTVVHLQDTKRLAALLIESLGVPAERIIVVLNRCERRNEVRTRDFAEALPACRIQTLPNDYHRARQSIDLGVPLFDSDPRSPLAKAIKELVDLATTPPAAAGEHPRGTPLGWLHGLRR